MRHLSKFNESSENSKASIKDMLFEVIYFRNHSLITTDSFEILHDTIETFIEFDLGERPDDLCPITSEEMEHFNLLLDSILTRVYNNSDVVNKIQNLYQEVRKKMKGLPKFSDIEDIFLDLIDDGYIIFFVVKDGSIEIEITNYGAGYDDFLKLSARTKNIKSRLEYSTNCSAEVVTSNFEIRGSAGYVEIKFKLTSK